MEQIHALIKKIGKSATYVLAPYICARLREAANLELLRSNRVFHDMCLTSWRSRKLWDDLLALRFPAETLKSMPTLAKLKAVYQCSLEEQFRSTADSHRQQDYWTDMRPDLRKHASDKDLPLDRHVCVVYWKQVFAKHAIYSMPVALFDACTTSPIS